MCEYFVSLQLWLDTDEELNEWNRKLEERVAVLTSKISKWEREKDDMKVKSDLLKATEKEYIQGISRLETEAEVRYELTHLLI